MVEDKLKARSDKLIATLLVEIHNHLIDVNEELRELRSQTVKQLEHKIDKPGYIKIDEEYERIKQKHGFDKDWDNFYDITNTITTAQAIDPGDFENVNYNRERIFQILDRYASIVQVANDGQDDLFVRVSHGGTTTFSRESIIRPGDDKKFWIVYELRLRSPTAGTPYRVTEYDIDTNCCPKASPNYFTAASLGDIPGVQTFSNIGFNNVIPTSSFILLSNVTSSTLVSNFPAVPQQMQLVSSSASDDGAPPGTGANEVTIDYLTDPSSPTRFTRFSEVVILNGTTPVNTIATNISRIERIHTSKVGTGSVAAGNISLQSVGGASTFEIINQGENVSRTCIHFVPNGFMSIITDILAGTTTAGGTRFAFTIVEADSSGNLVRTGRDEIGFASAGTTISFNTPIFLKNDSNRRISFAIAVRGLASNQEGSGSFQAIDIPI